MASDLNEYEIEVLRMLAGEIERDWGAWVAACLETLVAKGLAAPAYHITDAGRAALKEDRS